MAGHFAAEVAAADSDPCSIRQPRDQGVSEKVTLAAFTQTLGDLFAKSRRLIPAKKHCPMAVIRTRQLRETGLTVSQIGLETWSLAGNDGIKGYGKISQCVAIDTVRIAFESGITLYDCADVYGDGDPEPEKYAGHKLRERLALRVPPFLVQGRGEFFGLFNLGAAVPCGQLSIFVGWNESQRGQASETSLLETVI